MQQKDNLINRSLFSTPLTVQTLGKKTHTIPGDTSGVINDDNGAGLSLEWWLNSGSNFTGGSHRSTWTAEDNTDRNASNLGIGGGTSDFWQITGVQLEIGNTATPFEHRSFGDELLRCQRYHYRVNRDPGSGDEMAIGTGSINNTSTAQCYVTLPVTMRANSQAITESDLSVISGPNVTDVSLTSSLDEGNNCVGVNLGADSGTPFTTGRAVLLRVKNTSGAFFQVDSEL